jgi:hypothetical protein
MARIVTFHCLFLPQWSNGQSINRVYKSPASAPIVATTLKTKQNDSITTTNHKKTEAESPSKHQVHQLYLNGHHNAGVTVLNITAQDILKPPSY